MTNSTQTYQQGLISIIMPAFNHADLVIEMLRSVQANTYTHWELILVDDGSDNNEYQQIAQFIQTDARMRILKRDRQPKGAQTCRNIGFAEANGEYVCFFDSDDYISTTCLQQRVEAIASHPELDFMVFPTGLMKNGEVIMRSKQQTFGYPIYDDDLESLLKRVLPFIVCSNIYRTQSLKENGCQWDEQLRSMQDGDFNIQAILKGLKYAYSGAQPDYFYRIDTNNSVSKKICTPEHFDSHIYYIEKSYQTVHNRYKKQYNSALYKGVLFLFNLLFYKQIDNDYATRLCQVVMRYDRLRGQIFRIRLLLLKMLSHFMPFHLARRIAMFDFLLSELHETKSANQKRELYQEKHHIGVVGTGIFLLLFACNIQAQNLLWTPSYLENKQKEDTEVRIKNWAEHVLEAEIPDVTTKEKTFSGDKHNYESLGIYFWPDPKDPTAPYVFRDGQKNPERLLYDGAKINLLSYQCTKLSQAYALTKDKRYANRWNENILTWFIRKKTRMNPNFDYAQIIFNQDDNKGHYYGIIEAYVLVDVLESALLMKEENAISSYRFHKMQRWVKSFSDWMRESEFGQRQSQDLNNRALAYDVMMLEFYHFVGDQQRIDDIRDAFTDRRLLRQIAEDGSQPHELNRATPMLYHLYNLEHVVEFCKMQKSLGNDYYQQHQPRIDAAVQYIQEHLDKGILNEQEKANAATLRSQLDAIKADIQAIIGQ